MPPGVPRRRNSVVLATSLDMEARIESFLGGCADSHAHLAIAESEDVRRLYESVMPSKRDAR